MKFINRKFVWLILSLIVFSIHANAQEKEFDESVLSENGKQAYQTLLKENIFALFGVGFGGETSNGELALDILVEETKAIQALKNLVTNATPEGGLYALVGLKMLDCSCFETELAIYKKLPNPKLRKINDFEEIEEGYIRTQSGCLIGQKEKSEVVKEIQLGRMVEAKVYNYKIKKQNE